MAVIGAMILIAARARVYWPEGTFDTQKSPFLAFFCTSFRVLRVFRILHALQNSALNFPLEFIQFPSNHAKPLLDNPQRSTSAHD